MINYHVNPYFICRPYWGHKEYTEFNKQEITKFHKNIPGYKATPLYELPYLASKLNIDKIYVKDESCRFGLKAFKIMGASYAIYQYIKNKWEKKNNIPFRFEMLYDSNIISGLNLKPFCTATDGNHGRAVAWFSRLINHRAIIYMPENTVSARINNIKNEGADVRIIPGDYDHAVKQMAGDAEKNGWQIISDTSYKGYTQITSYIMAGYQTIFKEIDNNLEFDYIFLQNGVGSFAASAVWFYRESYRFRQPKLISVEPLDADCFLESIKYGKGQPLSTRGHLQSIMAGLNCGTPSLLAWPPIRDGVDFFMAVDDNYARQAMNLFYHPTGNDPQIVSGESGCAGLAGLIAVMGKEMDDEVRKNIGINSKSKILIFNTESDTDPENHHSIISH